MEAKTAWGLGSNHAHIQVSKEAEGKPEISLTSPHISYRMQQKSDTNMQIRRHYCFSNIMCASASDGKDKFTRRSDHPIKLNGNHDHIHILRQADARQWLKQCPDLYV